MARKKKAKNKGKNRKTISEESISKISASLERTEAIDKLVQAAVTANLDSEEVFKATMLGASEKGINLTARFLLDKRFFSHLSQLANTGKFSYTTFEAIAMFVHDRDLFQDKNVIRYLLKSEMTRENMRKVYEHEDRLLIHSIKKIISFRRTPSFYKDELNNLIKRACVKGKIVIAEQLAIWRKESLTTSEIEMLTTAIFSKST